MPHPSDEDLAQFLMGCSPDLLGIVLHALHSALSYDSHKYFGDLLSGKAAISPPHSEGRAEQVGQVFIQLGYFGSNSFAYGLRSVSPWHEYAGVPYGEILTECHALIEAKFGSGRGVATIDTVTDRESDIAQLLMRRTVAEIPDDELTQMLVETGMTRHAALSALKDLRNPTLGAAALISAGGVLGKKFVRDFMLAALASMLAKLGQKEGAKQLAIQLAKRFPQKAFSRLSSYLGWALLAWDAFKLTGPATRVTVPTVASLAILRTVDRLGGGS